MDTKAARAPLIEICVEGIDGCKLLSAATPAAASEPTAPARYAIALYRPNTRRRASGGASPIMACSSEVIGPDSFGSVERVPVSAAITSAGNQSLSA